MDWAALNNGVGGFWGLAALLTPALVWTGRRALFGRRKRWQTVVACMLLLFGIMVVQPVLRALWMNTLLWHKPIPLGKLPYVLPEWISNYMGGALLIYLGVMGAVLAWDNYQRYRERERTAAALELEKARLRASLSEARLEALQMQLQPHFLFNALHAISTLILKGETRGANEMLSHLSRFLRMTLDHADTPTVPLAVELESLDAYLRIQHERFHDRLNVALQIDERALSAVVPHLIFQPLVENSIRHGIAAETGAGTILVRALLGGGRLTLEVEDDGRGLPNGTAPADGVGLANVRERLEQLYPGGHDFFLCERPGGGTIARITIPFRTAAESGTHAD
jgi:LytS/YehU family sensor histidine kinase